MFNQNIMRTYSKTILAGTGGSGEKKICKEQSVTPVSCRSRNSQPKLLGTSAEEAAWAAQPPFLKPESRMHILLSQPSLLLSSINSSLWTHCTV